MGGIKLCLQQTLASALFEYDTPKVVQIKSRFIGLLFRCVQLAVLGYVIIWIFILNHGYQYIDTAAVGGVTTKLKGVASTASSDARVGNRSWDIVDLVVPPTDNGGFFVTTNVISTYSQMQGECPEQKGNGAECRNDTDCLPVGKPYHLGNGVSTGICDKAAGTCMVKAWCPLENDSLPEGGKYAMLNMTKDWTVFIKNHVHFPFYKKGRTNLIESIDGKKLRSCKYHPENDQYCPIFRLGDLISLAEDKLAAPVTLNDTYFNKIAVRGGVISIVIKWDCNFDYNETDCKPKYIFERLDNYQGSNVATGYNFRYAYNFLEDGIHKRQLIKAYGILFIVTSEAQARAFDTVTFFLNVGSGLALLGVASVCCDIFLLHVHRRKKFFKNHIFQNVTRDEQDVIPRKQFKLFNLVNKHHKKVINGSAEKPALDSLEAGLMDVPPNSQSDNSMSESDYKCS